MEWEPIRHGKTIVALRAGDYVIAKEILWGDAYYFGSCSGRLLTVACDADTAKEVAEEHENGDGV
jgi:hypothetical protein